MQADNIETLQISQEVAQQRQVQVPLAVVQSSISTPQTKNPQPAAQKQFKTEASEAASENQDDTMPSQNKNNSINEVSSNANRNIQKNEIIDNKAKQVRDPFLNSNN